jgi:hypothetical protein
MLHRTCRLACVALLSCELPLLMAWSASGQEAPKERGLFKGVKAVGVMVLTRSKKDNVLSEERLMTEAEIEVRKAGLRVLPDIRKLTELDKRTAPVRAKYAAGETLIIVIEFAAVEVPGRPPGAAPAYFYDYEVSTFEQVIVSRPGGDVVTDAQTWWRDGRGLDESKALREDIRASLNEFINQWLKDNEK